MIPKAPKPQSGPEELETYVSQLRDLGSTLRSRAMREGFRNDLLRKSRLYRSLADARPQDSVERQHFTALSLLFSSELDFFGPEPPPRTRRPPARPGTPLIYPDIPSEYPKRMHFLASGSLKRERSAALTAFAPYTSRQTANSGETLISVGLRQDQAVMYERLVESIGADGLRLSTGRADGFLTPLTTDPDAPSMHDEKAWYRLVSDNQQARLYHWTAARGLQPGTLDLPSDRPDIPASLPYDPDPRFRAILDLTERNDIEGAESLLDLICYQDREVIFDEVIYLRYLRGTPPRGTDLAYLARQYVAGSSIRTTIQSEFDRYLALLDEHLARLGPVPETLSALTSVNDYEPPSPPLADWPATRQHYFHLLDIYGHPVRPRGRIFVWNPDIGSASMRWVTGSFKPAFIAAENDFRAERGVPEIGKGWSSEATLFACAREIYNDAVHQWRPSFLGSQSIDIFLPQLNLAIEYQGLQHFEPVALFGGEEGFAATVERDARKRRLLASHGVRLLEWRYDTPISVAEIRAAVAPFTETA